jgi:hypothetical protein
MARPGPYDNGKGNGKGSKGNGKGGDQGGVQVGLWNDLIGNDDRRHFEVVNHETRTYLQETLAELEQMERNLQQILVILQLRIQQQRFALHVLRGD